MFYLKFIFNSTIFFILPFEFFGQISKGDFLLPISSSFVSNHSISNAQYFDNSKGELQTKEIKLNSKIGAGYSFTKNFIFGIVINQDNNWKTNYFFNGKPQTNKSSITLIGIFSRYYLYNKKIGIFVEPSYLIGKPKTLFDWEKEKIINTSVNSKTIGIGFNYFLSKNICTETILGFSKNEFNVTLKNTGNPTGYKSNQLIENSLKLNFGIIYKFKNKSI